MGLREPPATVTSVKSVSVPKHRTETQSRQIPTHYTGFTVGVNLAIGDPQGTKSPHFRRSLAARLKSCPSRNRPQSTLTVKPAEMLTTNDHRLTTVPTLLALSCAYSPARRLSRT